MEMRKCHGPCLNGFERWINGDIEFISPEFRAVGFGIVFMCDWIVNQSNSLFQWNGFWARRLVGWLDDFCIATGVYSVCSMKNCAICGRFVWKLGICSDGAVRFV